MTRIDWTQPQHCTSCDVLMRPSHKSLVDFPGTIAHRARGLCSTCAHRKRIKAKASAPDTKVSKERQHRDNVAALAAYMAARRRRIRAQQIKREREHTMIIDWLKEGEDVLNPLDIVPPADRTEAAHRWLWHIQEAHASGWDETWEPHWQAGLIDTHPHTITRYAFQELHQEVDVLPMDKADAAAYLVDAVASVEYEIGRGR